MIMPVPHKRICVDNLAIELTRRCNMSCEHCLRGDAGTLDMSGRYVRKILDQVDEISQVTFTGGEPCLNLEIIPYFYNQARIGRKTPGSFFVATNGTLNQERLAQVLLRAYMESEEKEYCGVAVSVDDFHEQYPSDYVRGLAFYTDVKNRRDDYENEWVLNRGRAAANGIGKNKTEVVRQFSVLDDDGILFVDQVYLSANGFVYPDCDLDYVTMDLNRNVSCGRLRGYLERLASGGTGTPVIAELPHPK